MYKPTDRQKNTPQFQLLLLRNSNPAEGLRQWARRHRESKLLTTVRQRTFNVPEGRGYSLDRCRSRIWMTLRAAIAGWARTRADMPRAGAGRV